MEYDSLTKFVEKIHNKVGSKKFTIDDISELADAKSLIANVDILKTTGMLNEASDGLILTESAISLVKPS